MNGSVEYPMHGCPQRPMYGVVLQGSVAPLIPPRSETEVRSRQVCTRPSSRVSEEAYLGGKWHFH